MTTAEEKAVLNRFTLELGRLYQAYRMYPPGVPHVQIAAEKCSECIREYGKPIRISKMGEDVIFEEEVLSPIPKQLEKILEAFNAMQWDSVRFEQEMGQRGLVELMRHLKEGSPGAYRSLGFVAGSLNVDSGEGEGQKTGYFTLVPKVNEMMEDLVGGKKSSWVRAREVSRLVTDHVMAGQNLFDPITNLKDYDEYTYTHALNVAAISIAVARIMELPEALVDAIGIGALCHDVGKQKVPYEVLRKPGRLTDEEREVMNRHPVDGAAIIVGIQGDVPPVVPVIAFQHHLRIDGSGYPQMPVHATPHPAPMLVAVADTFDAVRTVRPYQPSAYTPAGGLTVLVKEARANRLHPVFVSILARLSGTMTPGRHVKLSDGSEAVVLAEGEFDSLQPLVELVGGGEIMDLSMPLTPNIVSVEETLDD